MVLPDFSLRSLVGDNSVSGYVYMYVYLEFSISLLYWIGIFARDLFPMCNSSSYKTVLLFISSMII